MRQNQRLQQAMRQFGLATPHHPPVAHGRVNRRVVRGSKGQDACSLNQNSKLSNYFKHFNFY